MRVGAQRCKTLLPVTTESQGGSEGGAGGGGVGVWGGCYVLARGDRIAFRLPWINLLAGEL